MLLLITVHIPGEASPTIQEVDAVPFAIGRAADNDLVLNHPSISGHHAVIEDRSGGFLVRDLGSTNGMFINGEKKLEGTIVESTKVQLGLVVLDVETAPKMDKGVTGSFPALKDNSASGEKIEISTDAELLSRKKWAKLENKKKTADIAVHSEEEPEKEAKPEKVAKPEKHAKPEKERKAVPGVPPKLKPLEAFPPSKEPVKQEQGTLSSIKIDRNEDSGSSVSLEQTDPKAKKRRGLLNSLKQKLSKEEPSLEVHEPTETVTAIKPRKKKPVREQTLSGELSQSNLSGSIALERHSRAATGFFDRIPARSELTTLIGITILLTAANLAIVTDSAFNIFIFSLLPPVLSLCGALVLSLIVRLVRGEFRLARVFKVNLIALCLAAALKMIGDVILFNIFETDIRMAVELVLNGAVSLVFIYGIGCTLSDRLTRPKLIALGVVLIAAVAGVTEIVNGHFGLGSYRGIVSYPIRTLPSDRSSMQALMLDVAASARSVRNMVADGQERERPRKRAAGSQ